MSYVFKAGHRIRLKLTFGRPDGVTGSPVTVLSGGAQASEILLQVMATQR